MRFSFLILIWFCFNNVIAQDDDSLSRAYLNSETDSARISTLISWGNLYTISNSDLALQKLNKALGIASRSKSVKSQATVILEIGEVFSKNNFLDSSIYYYDIALQKFLSIDDSAGASKVCYKIGRVYFYSADFSSALDFFRKSDAYNASNPNYVAVATSKMAIGVVYEQIDSISEAIYYQELALKIKQKHNLEIHIPVSLNNLAVLHSKAGDKDKAREMLHESIEICERIGDSHYLELAFAHFTLGLILVEEKKFSESIPYIEKAVAIWEGRKSIRDLQEGYYGLYRANKGIGSESKALYFLEKNLAIKDSIYSEDRLASLREFDSKFKSREKEMMIENQQLQIEKEVKERELAEKQKSFQFYLFSAIIVVLLLNGVYLIFIYLRKRRDQKLILEQKLQLEVKNNEILDSITYAKRLQEAILPDQKQFLENFQDAFIFYKPKDIVAGDFYWFEKTEDTLFFAVADCTGHGVPGALVSVVCSNALAKAVLEFKLKDPGKILDTVRDLIVAAFNKGGTNVQDGMDISLCAVDIKTRKLKWAGANNSIWIAKKSDSENLFELKADKQPVGNFIINKNFTTHTIDLEFDDQVYLFTDGFADQFGGEKGKKFKYKSLKKLLFENKNRSLADQVNALDATFNMWRGDYEQVDDVCVVGIRI